MFLTTQAGLLGSSLLGLSAIVAGKPVAVGDSWTLKQIPLRVADGEDHVGTFTFKEVATVDGEECGRVTGEVTGWLYDPLPKCSCETLFSLSRRVPIRSWHRFESRRRKCLIETTLLPAESPAAAAPPREAAK